MFQVARTGNGTAPVVRWLAYTGTIVRGEVVIYDTGNVKVAGADPAAATIVGVALQANDTGPGFNQANAPVVSTYRQSKMCIAMANRETVFRGKLTNGSATRVAPVAANVGVNYGITAYSNVYTVDKNKTGADARVQVIGFDDLTNEVFFKFLEAFINTN